MLSVWSFLLTAGFAATIQPAPMKYQPNLLTERVERKVRPGLRNSYALIQNCQLSCWISQNGRNVKTQISPLNICEELQKTASIIEDRQTPSCRDGGDSRLIPNPWWEAQVGNGTSNRLIISAGENNSKRLARHGVCYIFEAQTVGKFGLGWKNWCLS